MSRGEEALVASGSGVIEFITPIRGYSVEQRQLVDEACLAQATSLPVVLQLNCDAYILVGEAKQMIATTSSRNTTNSSGTSQAQHSLAHQIKLYIMTQVHNNLQVEDYKQIGGLIRQDPSVEQEYKRKLSIAFNALIGQFLMKNKIGLIILNTVSIAASRNRLCAMPWNSILVDESELLLQTELDCVASIQHNSFASVGDTLQIKPIRLARG